ncbi:MAG: hypothetical protein MUC46_07365 [Desulfobacterales bacterium]|nr:hypothetical protein [Desulfobacterales bacterium]
MPAPVEVMRMAVEAELMASS